MFPRSIAGTLLGAAASAPIVLAPRGRNGLRYQGDMALARRARAGACPALLAGRGPANKAHQAMELLKAEPVRTMAITGGRPIEDVSPELFH